MKLRTYINEAYTSEMTRELEPYLKDIGDVLAKASISVQNLNFDELELAKPIVFNSSVREIKNSTDTSWYDEDNLVCVLKHMSDGVSVVTFDLYRNKITNLIKVAEFGNVTGKVTRIFKAKVSVKEINNLAKVKKERKNLNEPGKDKHNIKGKIDRKLNQSRNKIVKDIIKRGKAIGFTHFDFYGERNESVDDVYDFRISALYEGEKWVAGVPHIEIHMGFASKYAGYEWLKFVEDKYLNTKPDIIATYSLSSGSLDDAKDVDKWNNAKKKILEFVDIYEKARELAEYINTFTYNELLTE